MPLPSPVPGDPQKFTTAFRALETILREDEILSNIVKVWRTWTGEPDDGLDLAQPQKPVVRLTPGRMPLSFTEVDNYEGILTVKIEIALEGTNYDHGGDMMKVFLAAMRADKPFRDSTVRRYLQSQGCDIQYLDNGFDWTPMPPDQLIVSSASLRFFVPA
jgi:hypothetical protein